MVAMTAERRNDGDDDDAEDDDGDKEGMPDRKTLNTPVHDFQA